MRPMKLLLKSPDFCDVLSKLGEQWEVTEELVENIERFVCVIYGDRKEIAKIDEMRHFLLKSKCDVDLNTKTVKKIDFATLPPSKECLEEYIRCTNYQVRISQHYHQVRNFLKNTFVVRTINLGFGRLLMLQYLNFQNHGMCMGVVGKRRTLLV